MSCMSQEPFNLTAELAKLDALTDPQDATDAASANLAVAAHGTVAQFAAEYPGLYAAIRDHAVAEATGTPLDIGQGTTGEQEPREDDDLTAGFRRAFGYK